MWEKVINKNIIGGYCPINIIDETLSMYTKVTEQQIGSLNNNKLVS